MRASRSTKAAQAIEEQVRSALEWLKTHSTKATLDGMARYGIPSDQALGVAMRDIKMLGGKLGHNHEVAAALWETGVYEARMLASFVGDPSRLTSAQMDRWCRDFDNWAICDAMSFNLFDRTPHAWAKVTQWSTRRPEFEKRAAFALLWSLTVHDKLASDEQFLHGLALVEREAADQRHFVKKAVTWPYAPSANAILSSIQRQWRWRGVWETRGTQRRSGWARMHCESFEVLKS